ncbi:MAG: FkbM family methyltransferase [Deltaproteobacteria bacterium]|nr:FkbM family methyltransferase [Deltaproteobacteria bacterium]
MIKEGSSESVLDALRGDFVAVNLGCAGDPDPCLPAPWRRILTVVEVDASEGSETTSRFHRRIALRGAVAGTAGRHPFRRNTFSASSSLRPPRAGLIEAYGMERYYQVAEVSEVECRTLPDVLADAGVARVDFLKTDLEGMDFEVLRTMVPRFGDILAIQAELRFEPFYEGEPHFHEVVSYLAEHGFQLLDLKVERWKFRTRRRRRQRQGHAVWADVVFLREAERIAQKPRLLAKQIALARMLGKKNRAEYLLEQHGANLPEAWQRDLDRLICSRCRGVGRAWRGGKRWLHPWLLWLKHRIGRSEHVAIP